MCKDIKNGYLRRLDNRVDSVPLEVYVLFSDLFEHTKTKFGNINVLVNNAGILNEGLPERTVEINLVGVCTISYFVIKPISLT